MELHTTRKNGDRQFLRIGGCKQEFDIFRRFFKGFKQRIEAVTREHMHFVNQIDLKAPNGWFVLHVIEQFTGIFDFRA